MWTQCNAVKHAFQLTHRNSATFAGASHQVGLSWLTTGALSEGIYA